MREIKFIAKTMLFPYTTFWNHACSQQLTLLTVTFYLIAFWLLWGGFCVKPTSIITCHVLIIQLTQRNTDHMTVLRQVAEWVKINSLIPGPEKCCLRAQMGLKTPESGLGLTDLDRRPNGCSPSATRWRYAFSKCAVSHSSCLRWLGITACCRSGKVTTLVMFTCSKILPCIMQRGLDTTEILLTG